MTLFNPLPLRRFDLIHAFNRIPIGATPFIIGFESHLPRSFGYESTRLFRAISDILAGNRCKAIIAISDYARRQFLDQHKRKPDTYDALAKKLTVRYPNFPLALAEPDGFEWHNDKPLRLVFVGNHFGRKGGSVAVRLAERALQRGVALHVDIVSTLEMGDASWVSPTRADYWEHDIGLLQSLPNIKHHRHLPNEDVIALMRKAHFVLLPTFSDSFGYSAIEAMAVGTPVIATRQCALPEFIKDGVNGLLLDLEINAAGEWRHTWRTDRTTSDYETLFDREVSRLAEDAWAKIENCMQSPPSYLSLRAKARQTAEKLFSPEEANRFWDDFYVRIMSS